MDLPKNYYPTYHHGCNPIHPVKDWAYVRHLIRAARHGTVIPPILIDGQIRSGTMLNGTHRSAANDILVRLGQEPLIPVVSLDEIDVTDELAEAVEQLDYETIDLLLDR